MRRFGAIRAYVHSAQGVASMQEPAKRTVQPKQVEASHEVQRAERARCEAQMPAVTRLSQLVVIRLSSNVSRRAS